MCEFFSFVSDPKGNFHYFGAKDRKYKGVREYENYDSHTSIIHKYISKDPRMDCRCNKFEYVNGIFLIDQINGIDNRREAEAWVSKFVKTKEFQKICELESIVNGNGFQYLKRQTKEIKFAMIRSDGFNIRYVKKPTYEMKVAAIRNEPNALRYIGNQTEELCKIAIRKDPYSIAYIKNQTPKLCKMALFRDAYTLSDIKTQTKELCLFAVKRNGMLLEYVENPDQDIINAAVENEPLALEYVEVQNKYMCLKAVKKNPRSIRFVKNQTYEIKKEAIKKDGECLKYVESPTVGLCKMAIKQNPIAIRSVPIGKITQEMIIDAFKRRPGIITDVLNEILTNESMEVLAKENFLTSGLPTSFVNRINKIRSKWEKFNV